MVSSGSEHAKALSERGKADPVSGAEVTEADVCSTG